MSFGSTVGDPSSINDRGARVGTAALTFANLFFRDFSNFLGEDKAVEHGDHCFVLILEVWALTC